MRKRPPKKTVVFRYSRQKVRGMDKICSMNNITRTSFLNKALMCMLVRLGKEGYVTPRRAFTREMPKPVIETPIYFFVR